MNIVVTIPKSKMAQIEREEKHIAKQNALGIKTDYFWALNRKPTKLKVGDRVYFVWDGAVRAWHEVIGFEKDLRCTTTGEVYREKFCIKMDAMIHEIKPIPMGGFRGFRYHKGPE